MRILFAIPHYVRQAGDQPYSERPHGSLDAGAARRAEALTACLAAFHQLYQPANWMIGHEHGMAYDAPADIPHKIDAIICTASGRHILDQLSADSRYYTHRSAGCPPELLGFFCHDVLREHLGGYDYYCYLEDDLILHDCWLFVKLAWFNAQFGDGWLLQPNRYECGIGHAVPRVYVDGSLAEDVTAPFQDVRDTPPVSLEVMGQRIGFERTLNPHSGCFFLNARQMEHWVQQPHFRDRESRFIGPLETAATLGVLRTFKIYKPALANADFLAVQHHGTGYLERLVKG